MAEKEIEEDIKDSKGDVAAPKKRKVKLYLLVSLGVLLLILAIGIPTAIYIIKTNAAAGELAADAAQTEILHAEGWSDPEDEYDEGEEPLGAIYPLHTFVVNLADNKMYLRCQIQLEFSGETIPQRFYVRQVPIRDALIKLLGSLEQEDLSGPSSKEDLKDKIKETVNTVLKREEVKKVYFTQFITQ